MKNKKIREIAEMLTLRYLMNQFPSGLLSVVSDTYDIWDVCKPNGVLSKLKDEILQRDGKIVIRPDSGDPVDIICGKSVNAKIIRDDFEDVDGWIEETLIDIVNDETPHGEHGVTEKSELFFHKGEYFVGTITNIYWNRHDKQYYYIDMWEKANIIKKPVENISEVKGVVELLWDIFGGTINEQGYKVLDPHIGAIYGDSITPQRAKEICERLEAKGFASTNVVLGIGSFTYQYVTRDTHGFAMKATYCEVKEHIADEVFETRGREIFKDPITDDGTKKSAKGLLMVEKEDDKYVLYDQVNWKKENSGELQTIFKDGKYYNQTTLTEIRKRLS